MPNNTLIEKLHHWWCGLWTGHYNMAVFSRPKVGHGEWYLRCIYCAKRSHGWAIEHKPLPSYSNADFEDLHDFMLATELSLHSGG